MMIQMVWMKIAVFRLNIQNQILPILIFLNYTTDQVQVGSAYESSPLVQVNSNKCKQNYKLIPMSISICIAFFLLRPKHLKVKENNRHTVISTCMAASHWPLCLFATAGAADVSKAFSEIHTGRKYEEN